MKKLWIAFVSMAVLATVVALQAPLFSQQPGGAGKGGFGGVKGGPGGGAGKGKATPANLPSQPTAVTLPTMSAKVTGPGAIYESAAAQWPGRDVKFYKYDTDEYFLSGTANGKPYKTRLVIRKPSDNSKFSGLVMAESMHPAGGAHGFEFNSIYLMSSGHIAAEILTSGNRLPAAENAQRYADLTMSGDQVNEILAQAGALLKSSSGPLAGMVPRKVVLFGTSASSAVLVNYLPAHRVYRTPDMKNIYDGFIPTSNGSEIPATDVPMIQVPTMHEYERIGTIHQDSDKAGEQFRVYEFAAMAHLESRNNRSRLLPTACVNPLSDYPMEAYMSVALHHLFQWVDKGIPAPKAERILIDRNVTNDGSLMMLDPNGNPQGGIRNPYVDVAAYKYTARNQASPQDGNPQLCGLSAYQTAIPPAKLKQLYKNKTEYVKKVEARLNELEKQGWSLPVYHDLIMADAKALPNF